MSSLSDLIRFVEFTHAFQAIERVARRPRSPRMESDAEHACQLALVAWYLISTNKLSLNIDLVIKYALAHDLVEAYAGDTYIYDADLAAHASKKKREADALRRIEDEFPEFPDLITIIEQYEKRDDAESRFLYALDKLLPPLQGYLEDGALWHERGLTLQQILNAKDPTIALSPEIEPYWLELRTLMQAKEDILFAPKLTM